ncbi:MAG: N-acetylmuramoyl-L-alanine amidase [Alphaproteobacteria bacterium]
MRKPIYILSFFITAITLMAAIPAYAFDVTNIRFGQHPDKTRLVIELSEEQKFRIFMLSDPNRMVIDLPAFTWHANGIKDSKKAGITAIRHGNLKAGISRIVLDMNAPIKILNAFTLPKNPSAPPRLVIDFAKTSQSELNAAQNKTFGTLNVDNAQFASPAPAPKPKPVTKSTKPANQKPLIIIDPGHGGVDPGAIGANKVHEKRVVLALAKELKQQLEASGQYRVKMTRDTDNFIKLSNRVKFARRHQGDLFISIHADSLRDSGVSGASIYTLSEKASDAQTAKLAARENKADLIAGIDIEVEDEAVMDILIDLARRNTQNQSKFFANSLVDIFKSNGIKTLRRPHRYANFAVLKAPDIPSILVEAGFMSNKAEANRLNSTPHRRKIATALKKGIDHYFKTVRDNEKN